MATKKKTTSFITTPELSRQVKAYARTKNISMGAAVRNLLGIGLTLALFQGTVVGAKKKCS